MSTDTIYQRLRSHLSYLKLTAAADALAPVLEAAEREKPGYTRFLHDLLQTEVAATEQRRLDGRMRFAKLPAHKTLEQFDFDAQPTRSPSRPPRCHQSRATRGRSTGTRRPPSVTCPASCP
jgi:DNA replication protein DnaC